MSHRDQLHRWARLVSALALLVAVMTSPIRPANPSAARLRTDYLRRNFAIPPSCSSRLCANPLTSRVASVKTVLTEAVDETRRRATCPAGRSVDPPPWPSPGLRPPDRAVFAPTPPSHRPLRC